MISVVVPVYNEEKVLERTLFELTRQLDSHELICVDGGSSDRSAEIARRFGKVLTSEKGRAAQMNRGAAEGWGETLLFLPADSVLETGALGAVEEAVQQGYVGGCFTQRIQGERFLFRTMELSGNVRAQWLHIFYGDQAIFVKRRLFQELGGFPNLPLFEDVAFTRRLRWAGRTVVLRNQVYTSARRWERGGILKECFRNWSLLGLYALGVRPGRLARFYPDVR